MMADVIVFREDAIGWVSYVALPSLDPRSKTKGAILYIAEASRVETRKPCWVKAVATGINVHVLDDC